MNEGLDVFPGNFANGSPLGLMGARPPQSGVGLVGGSVGVPGPEKRLPHEEAATSGGRERRKRSRWSDAPEGEFERSFFAFADRSLTLFGIADEDYQKRR